MKRGLGLACAVVFCVGGQALAAAAAQSAAVDKRQASDGAAGAGREGGAAPQGFRIIEQPEALVIAREKGWLVRQGTPLGGAIELQRLVNGIPHYYATENRSAADSLSTDECWPGGTGGLSLEGTGVRLGIWDGGRVRSTHQEFGGRVTPRDDALTNIDHATHVAATMIGAGLSPVLSGWPAGQSKGMAPQALLDSYDFSNDQAEMGTAAAGGLRISNHSYGTISGWTFGNFGPGVGWYWFGDVTVSLVVDYGFGFYDPQAKAWDRMAHDHPHYLMVKSAGNDRNEGPASGTSHYVFIGTNWVTRTTARSLDGDGGYDSISYAVFCLKNLTVGAATDVVGGYAGPGSVGMTSFSCWGPTDDGRIKPDVVGNGFDLLSAFSSSNTAYGIYSGTSMSSPNVSGSLGLLLQHYRDTHGGSDPQAATLKGVVIHTADEAGAAAGPDYAFGWGLVNTLTAANQMTLDQANPGLIQELWLSGGQVVEQTWASTGAGPLKATICWTDVPGSSPAPALDPADKALVNDLNLVVIGPDSVSYFPWILNGNNPTAPAATGVNDRDNVEVVYVQSPPRARIRSDIHAGTLVGGAQSFSLILSGVDSGPALTGACCQLEGCAGTTTEAACLADGGAWYGGTDCATFSCPARGACCTGCPPSTACEFYTLSECNDINGRWQSGIDCSQTTCAMPGNQCATDRLTATEGSTSFDNRCATNDGPSSIVCDGASSTIGSDIWYGYTATCTGTLSIDLCADTDFDAILLVYSDGDGTCVCPANSSTQIGCADDTCGLGGGPPRLSVDVIEGRCYTIRVAGWEGAIGTGTMSISCTVSLDAPLPLPGDVKKMRYVSFIPANAGQPTAMRVASATDPSQFSYVNTLRDGNNQPVFDCPDSGALQTIFKCAVLSCTPEYRDWGTDLSGSALHVTGIAVRPGMSYEVAHLAASCAGSEPACTAVAGGLIIGTAGWGDVDGDNAINVLDLAKVVDKVKDLASGTLIKPRTQMQPQEPNPLANVNVLDISRSVESVKSFPYPYAGPAPCP